MPKTCLEKQICVLEILVSKQKLVTYVKHGLFVLFNYTGFHFNVYKIDRWMDGRMYRWIDR